MLNLTDSFLTQKIDIQEAVKPLEAGDMRDSRVANSANSTDLRVRIITATILLPVAILLSFAGGWLFLALVLPVMCIGMLEFYVMEKDTAMQGSSLTGIPTGVRRSTWFLPTSRLALAGCSGTRHCIDAGIGVFAPSQATWASAGAGGYDAMWRHLYCLSGCLFSQLA